MANLEKALELVERLKAVGLSVKADVSDNSPGWKFAEYEMKGVPLRIEIGPRDIEAGCCVFARRDTGEKATVALDALEACAIETLDAIHENLFNKAKKHLEENTFDAATLDEAARIINEKGGFVRTMWCGDVACEEKFKEVAGVSSRCIPFKQEHLGDTCACCGRPAEKMVVWGVAY